MTQEQYDTYRHPASVTCFRIEGVSGERWGSVGRWGYGWIDMLQREPTLPGIGTIARVIVTQETVSPNRFADGSEHPEVKVWALVELESKRIVEVSASVFRSVIDPRLQMVTEGKPQPPKRKPKQSKKHSPKHSPKHSKKHS